jgi:hypothetical protein
MMKTRAALSVMTGPVPAIYAVRLPQSQRVHSGLPAWVGVSPRKIPIESGGSPTSPNALAFGRMTGTSPVMTVLAEISPAQNVDAW